MSDNYERPRAPEPIPEKYLSVRENRGKNWYWANNHLYDEIKNNAGEATTFAAVLGSFAINVYHLLARLIDNESQTCWPSYPYIARRCGMSRTTTIAAIKKLEAHQLLSYKQRDLDDGKSDSNLYTLRPIHDWIINSPDEVKKPTKKKKSDTSPPPVLEGAPEIPPSATGERGGASNDGSRVRQMDGEGAPDGLYKDPAYQNPIKQDSQQQQAQQKPEKTEPSKTADGGVAAGGGVDDLSDQKNGAEIDGIVEKLDSFKTGLAKSIIRPAVIANRAHCELWATWWPYVEESNQSYWQTHKGTMGGALRIRLTDTSRIPAQLSGKINAQEHRAATTDGQREAKAAEAARIAKEEQLAAEHQVNFRRIWSEYSVLIDGRRHQIDDRARIIAPLAVDTVQKRGGIDKLDQNSPVWRDFIQAVGVAMEDQEAEDQEGEEVVFDMAMFIEEQIDRFVEQVDTGECMVDNLDRGDWNDAQWAQIVDGVAARIKKRKAA